MGAKLHISDTLTLPAEAVTHTFGLLAMRGAGKSNAAVVMAEEMYDAGLHWVAIDPKGDWWGVRSSRDGKGPGLPVPIFGGQRGDLPLEPDAGSYIADLIVDNTLTCVLDLSEFTEGDKIRFLGGVANKDGFAARFYKRKQPTQPPTHVFLEEADDYLPQRFGKDKAKLMHDCSRMVLWGRQRGIGATAISQRSARINKDVLTQTESLIVLRTTGPQDIAAVKEWVKYHGVAEELLASLSSLENGEAWVFSPHWLKKVERIRFRQRRTFDSGSTPLAGGQQHGKPATLADVNIAAVKEKMAASIEKALAEDPKELRKKVAEKEREIAGLRKQLAKGGGEKPADPAERERRERDWLEAEKLGYERGVRETGKAWRPVARAVDAAKRALEVSVPSAGVYTTPSHLVARPPQVNPDPRLPPGRPALPEPVVQTPARAEPVLNKPAARAKALEVLLTGRVPAPAPSNGLGAGERQVLIAIAQYPDGADRELIGILTGYKRSTRDAYIQRLVARGYACALSDGSVVSAAEGVSALGSDFEPLPTGDALREWWMRRLPEGERKVLEAIIRGWTNREQISENTGYKRSTRDAYIQRLALRKLVRPGPGGDVTVSGALFD